MTYLLEQTVAGLPFPPTFLSPSLFFMECWSHITTEDICVNSSKPFMSTSHIFHAKHFPQFFHQEIREKEKVFPQPTRKKYKSCDFPFPHHNYL